MITLTALSDGRKVGIDPSEIIEIKREGDHTRVTTFDATHKVTESVLEIVSRLPEQGPTLQ